MSNQIMKIFTLLAAIPSVCFALDTPIADGTESGVGVIAGFHCTATNITLAIDGESIGKAGSGTLRPDTAQLCGHAETGYSLQYNFNRLAPGSHTISIFNDGQLTESRQFNTVQSAGAEFASGLSKTVSIADFPSVGKTATLQWVQAKQSFVVTGITTTPGSGAVDMSSLQGSYTQAITISVSGNSCAAYGAHSGTATASFNFTTSGNSATAMGYTPTDSCAYNFTYASGNSTSGFNLTGSVQCSSGISTSATGSNIRKSGGKLLGSVYQSLPGCTETITF